MEDVRLRTSRLASKLGRDVFTTLWVTTCGPLRMNSNSDHDMVFDPSLLMISQLNSDLIEEIKALQADRQKHAEAIAAIDAVLSRIGQTLTSMRTANGAQDSLQGAGESGPIPEISFRPITRSRKYRKLPLTGDEFVLDLVRRQGSPTTHQINTLWRAQGRGGVANNVIGRLLKQGLIEREPLEDQRGSKYRLTERASDT